MWGWIISLLRVILPFLFSQATTPASQTDANAPKELKEDLNAQVDELPPTPDE